MSAKKIDRAAPGMRFQGLTRSDDDKLYRESPFWQQTPTQKVCDICGEPYESSVRVHLEKGNTFCVHDDPSTGVQGRGVLSQAEERRVASRLKPHERAVKGNDGMIRILEQR